MQGGVCAANRAATIPASQATHSPTAVLRSNGAVAVSLCWWAASASVRAAPHWRHCFSSAPAGSSIFPSADRDRRTARYRPHRALRRDEPQFGDRAERIGPARDGGVLFFDTCSF